MRSEPEPLKVAIIVAVSYLIASMLLRHFTKGLNMESILVSVTVAAIFFIIFATFPKRYQYPFWSKFKKGPE